MISAAATKSTFSNPQLMKERFREVTAQAAEKQKFVDKIDSMANAFLSLDQSEHDQDNEEGSVAVEDKNGSMAFVQANPLGGAMSFDYLKESGDTVEEYNIETGMFGQTYTMDVNGVEHSVFQDGKGLLALMELAEILDPGDGESADKPEDKS